MAGNFFPLRGVLASPDFFALERKARLASERSGEACAGLQRKSKKIGRQQGVLSFSCDFFHSCHCGGVGQIGGTCTFQPGCQRPELLVPPNPPEALLRPQ